MKKKTKVILTLLCISAVLMAVGICLALSYGDTFKTDSNSLLFYLTVGCIILSAVLFSGTISIAILFPLSKTKIDPSAPVKRDERQTLYSGKAAECSLTTMTFAAFLMLILDAIGVPQFAEPNVLLFLNVLLGVLVYGVYRIWNDAYFVMNQNKKTSIFLFAFMIVICLRNGISDLLKGEAIADGLLTEQSLILATGIMSVIVLATMGIKALKDRKEEEE